MTIKNYAQHKENLQKTDTSDTETDVDTEVGEEQIAINKRQELTGDPLPQCSTVENLEKSNLPMCSWGKQHSQIYFTGQ